MRIGDLEDGRSKRYVFLWVRILDNPIWKTLSPSVFKVAIGFLLSANFRPAKWYDGHEEHVIPRGSFVTSINRCAEFCRLSVQQTRTAWSHLANMEFSTFTTTHYGTIVNITNYDCYQPGEVQANTPSNTTSTRRQHDVNTHKVKESEVLEAVDFTLSPFGEPASHPVLSADYKTVGSALPGLPGLNPPVDGKPWFPEGMALNGNGTRAKLLAAQRAFEEWFEKIFWPKYPRKVGKAKAKRAAANKMITDERRAQAMARLEFELPGMLACEPKYRPHASTWFNGDAWANPIELDPPVLVSQVESAWDKLI